MRWVVALVVAGAAHAEIAAVGMVEINANGHAYRHTTVSLQTHEKVLTQFAGADGVQKCCTWSRVAGSVATPEGVSDEANSLSIKSYRLARVPKNKSLYLGLAVAPRSAQVRSDGVGLFLFENRQLTVARTCLGNEGIHALETTGGVLKTHIYKGFDYAVTATCTDEDLEPKKP